MMAYYYDEKRFRYSTGYSTMGRWNFRTQRLRTSTVESRYEEINLYLDDLEDALESVVAKLKRRGVVLTNSVLKIELSKALNQDKVEKYLSFFKFTDKFIDGERRRGVVMHKSYRTTYNKLWDYNPALDYHDFDDKFYDKFIRHLSSKGYSTNYIGRIIKNLKCFLKAAKREGHHNLSNWKEYRVRGEQVYNIYLNVDELLKIHHTKYEQPGVQRAADMFLVGCFTGMRFTDFIRLTKENLQGFVVQDTSKTGAKVVIPYHWILKEILEKYNYELPKPISNQKFNEHLKMVGEKAKIDTIIYKTRTEGGRRITKKYKKWELISSHTARRSMATNMYLAGIPVPVIMQITGHKTEAEFFKYIKIQAEEVANNLKDHPFFNK